jgi:fibronectin-binding autotransporter adhesin
MLTTIAMMARVAMAGDDCAEGRVTLDGADQPDLATALAAAVDGSQIDVCAGTYVGNFVSTAVVDLVALEGAEDTILDGNLTGTVLTLPGGSTIEGFTVTRGAAATNGGGLRLASPGETLILDCVFEGNQALAGQGGAVHGPDGSTVLAWDSAFLGNTAASGGGIALGSATVQPGIPNVGTLLDLDGSVVSGNTAAGTLTPLAAGRGGGVLAYDAIVLEGEVSANLARNRQAGFCRAIAQGGGIALVRNATVEDTEISANTSEGSAGGLLLSNGTTVVLDDVLVEGNASTDFLGSGGGVFVSAPFSGSSHVIADGTRIVGNHSPYRGGGVALSGPDPGILTWTGGEIAENTAPNGGGLYLSYGSIALEEVEFVENVATRYGGGVAGGAMPTFFAWTLSITGCLFDANVAETRTGGGVDLGQPATITDTEFVDNVAAQGGALSLYGWGTRSPTPMAYTLVDVELKNNEATVSGGALNITNDAAVTATDVELKKNDAPVGGGLFVENGSIDAIDSEFDKNDPDDVWVAKIATGYTDLEDFFCDNTGCIE